MLRLKHAGRFFLTTCAIFYPFSKNSNDMFSNNNNKKQTNWKIWICLLIHLDMKE